MWLTEKLGPLPRVAWIGGGVATALGIAYFRRSKGKTTAAVMSSTDTGSAAQTDVSGTIGTPVDVIGSTQGVGALPSNQTAQAAQPTTGQGGGRGKQAGKAGAKPAGKPAGKPAAKPAGKPAAKPGTRSTRPATPSVSMQMPAPAPTGRHQVVQRSVAAAPVIGPDGVYQPVIEHPDGTTTSFRVNLRGD